MRNEEVQDKDVLIYLFTGTFESKGNQRVADKLVKPSVERQTDGALRFKELGASLQWILAG